MKVYKLKKVKEKSEEESCECSHTTIKSAAEIQLLYLFLSDLVFPGPTDQMTRKQMYSSLFQYN